MHTLLVVIVIRGLFSKQIISSLYMIDVLDQKLAELDLPDFLVCFDTLALTTPHGKGSHHHITRNQKEWQHAIISGSKPLAFHTEISPRPSSINSRCARSDPNREYHQTL